MTVNEYLKNPHHRISITVIGAGGTGTEFLRQLAKIAVSYHALRGVELHVLVFDGDKVDTPNVGRQLFHASEIGMNKAEAIVSKINRTYGLNWIAKDHHFTTGEPNEQFKKNRWSNFIISCVDNVGCRQFIHDFWNAQKEPVFGDDVYCEGFMWFDVGNNKTQGQVIIKSSLSRSIIDMFPDITDDADDTPSCSLAEALSKQDLFVNTFAASIAGKLLWDVLKNNRQDNGGVFFNLDTFNYKTIPLNDGRAQQDKLQNNHKRKQTA